MWEVAKIWHGSQYIAEGRRERLTTFGFEFFVMSSHDLEGYFESLAEQGFQNNFFSVLARENGG